MRRKRTACFDEQRACVRGECCQVRLWYHSGTSETFPESAEQPVASAENPSVDDAVIAGLHRASQQLYDAIQGYLIDIPDSELPPDLVATFDAFETAWRRSD